MFAHLFVRKHTRLFHSDAFVNIVWFFQADVKAVKQTLVHTKQATSQLKVSLSHLAIIRDKSKWSQSRPVRDKFQLYQKSPSQVPS